MARSDDNEILIAIAICGQSFEDTLEQLLSGKWTDVFEEWKRDLLNRFCSNKPDLKSLGQAIAAFNLFRAYLQDGYERPPVWSHKAKKGISLSAPWELLLKNRLVMAGYSEVEVLNGYLPGRWYDFYTVTELRAAETCMDEKKWRKVFYTEEDSEKLSRARRGE